MLIEAVILSVIIGLIRGGKIKGLKRFSRKSLWFLIIGIVIQGSIIIMNNLVEFKSIGKILTYSKELVILSYILILLGIIGNYTCRPLWIALIGYIMNFIPLVANNWKKPILIEGLQLTKNKGLIKIIENRQAGLYTPLIEGVKYPVLGNYIVFSKPYLLAKVVSLGDFIIGIGIFILIQDLMKNNRGYTMRY